MLPYSPVLAPAKGAGHLLAKIASESVTNAVRKEVETELNAVVSAELGDLTGRGAQAVVLTRWSSSPTQVQAAWDLLNKDPLGCTASMKTTLDPTSAAVAAAAWILGAAEIAAEESGTELATVIADADDIEALPTRTPMEVLDRLEQGETPTEAVSELIAEAQRVAEGLFPDLTGIAERLAELIALAERAPEAREALIGEAKICFLDPARPGPDLLEDLLTGIWGCFLVWSEHTWEEREPEGLAEDDEITPEQSAEMNRLALERFRDLLREAMSEADRFAI